MRCFCEVVCGIISFALSFSLYPADPFSRKTIKDVSQDVRRNNQFDFEQLSARTKYEDLK